MLKTKNNLKADAIIIQNIYKNTKGSAKFRDILLKSYIIFIHKEHNEMGAQ